MLPKKLNAMMKNRQGGNSLLASIKLCPIESEGVHETVTTLAHPADLGSPFGKFESCDEKCDVSKMRMSKTARNTCFPAA